MAQQPESEQPSTYVVEDRSNKEEMARLSLQDHLLTASMGGVLPEQPEPASLRRILDVGCATGGWLRETALAYPDISMLVGVDVSKRMIEYARARTAAEQLGDRVEFRIMDALRTLEFPDKTFDLVTHRLAQSWLRIWDWPKVLQEYRRVTQPGGIIRCVEGTRLATDQSPALLTLNALLQAALHRAGHLFSPDSAEWTEYLPQLFRQQGLENIQSRLYALEYHAGTEECTRFCEDLKSGFHTLSPFLHKWIQVPDEYEEIYQRMLREIQRPDFQATSNFLITWGSNPLKNSAFPSMPR